MLKLLPLAVPDTLTVPEVVRLAPLGIASASPLEEVALNASVPVPLLVRFVVPTMFAPIPEVEVPVTKRLPLVSVRVLVPPRSIPLLLALVPLTVIGPELVRAPVAAK